ncbi:MAG: methionine adenosyltransferase domain-containing protein, partial [Cytophagales bacterium]|nr:methionine adenosyltransferase domain-containing protein [Cytophagales bacterium]
NMVAAGLCDEVLVQVSYAIGVAKPMGIYINTYGTAKVNLTDGEIAKQIEDIFDMRPYAIEKRLAYGHMGREPRKVTKIFVSPEGKTVKKEVELFTWERLDYVDKIRKAFKLK